MASRQKTRDIFIQLINLQLEPHGKTYNDVVNESDWYMKYSTTREKEEAFIQTAIGILRTKLRMTKSVAEKEINWFILQWGLTTVNTADTIDSKTLVKSKPNNNVTASN